MKYKCCSTHQRLKYLSQAYECLFLKDDNVGRFLISLGTLFHILGPVFLKVCLPYVTVLKHRITKSTVSRQRGKVFHFIYIMMWLATATSQISQHVILATTFWLIFIALKNAKILGP